MHGSKNIRKGIFFNQNALIQYLGKVMICGIIVTPKKSMYKRIEQNLDVSTL
jgi:hypothetical protein